MTNSIMEALFDGRVIPWERRGDTDSQRRSVEEQIERETRYFIQKMSLDDCQRLQNLETLYRSMVHSEETEIYAHGFTLGALLMLEVMAKKDSMLPAGHGSSI